MRSGETRFNQSGEENNDVTYAEAVVTAGVAVENVYAHTRFVFLKKGFHQCYLVNGSREMMTAYADNSLVLGPTPKL